MDKQALDGICRKQLGSTHDYQVDWQADRYHIGGKMFAVMGSDSKGVPIITLKCDPARTEELRERYEGIIPAYHMNKTHWNSIYIDADFPDDLWEKLIVHSYELVLQKLPKSAQQQIQEENK